MTGPAMLPVAWLQGIRMHDILISVWLGIVEGLTEFLPVSSTGHLLVAERLLGLSDNWEAFTVVIQLGAILAVVVVYFQTFWQALIQLPSSADARRFALGIIVALIPSVIAGLALKKFLDNVLLNPTFAMPFIAICWIVGGIVILVLERVAPKPRWFEGNRLPVSKAFQIGCCQILSIIPGVSRSGATILGGEMLGVERKAATLFTFYLAVPTMMGATILELRHAGAALSSVAKGWLAVIAPWSCRVRSKARPASDVQSIARRSAVAQLIVQVSLLRICASS